MSDDRDTFTRREIAFFTAIGTGCLFMSAAKMRDGDMSTWWDWSGLVVGIGMLVIIAVDLWRQPG